MAFLKQAFCVLLLALLLAAAGGSGVMADDDLHMQEQEIKAGLLYNFLKYIQWPSGAAQTADVCVFDNDPFAGYLQPMAGRTVNQRTIAIRSIHDMSEAAACQLLFLSSPQKDRWPQLHKSLANKDILTVGDFGDFAATGGMIEFTRRGDHIAVDLNMDSVTAARLQVEDRLLKLVTVVHPGKP